jgi:ERF superfamily
MSIIIDQIDYPAEGAVIAQQQQRDDSLMAVLYRAATDPSCDIARMEKLLALHQTMEAAAREREFDAAMSKAQGKMQAVLVDRENTQTHSKYASYYALDKAVRPIYSKHGFALTFFTEATPDSTEVICLACRVSHTSGYSRRYDIPMPTDGKGARGNDVMTKTHALGSAVRYGMRYLLTMIFNLAIRGDRDDDGNGADPKLITRAQVAELGALLTASPEINIEKFLIWIGQSSLEEIPAAAFQKARRGILDAGARNTRKRTVNDASNI